MGADRARLTYTASRQYREVVSQQGRVTLEADVNEASRLGSEALRTETVEVVGPVGSPDGGYGVTPSGLDLTIGHGTMYVGGLRMALPTDIKQSAQPDWQDTATDPLWLQQANITGNAALVLLVQEQEVSAVEDPALRETALGGPDSAARTRMLQRFLLIPVNGITCPTAAPDIAAFWAARGRDIDTTTATLVPRSRLMVTPLKTPPAASPCDPPAQSGYLGADNQLIRVQITAFDSVSGTGRLLWGWNNASTLYRCAPLDDVTLQLATRPVAPEFTPGSGQAVQLLMPAADLGEGAIAAALGGHVATLNAAFQPDNLLVTLPGQMPPLYRTPPTGMPLFLQLWQEDLPFTLGNQVELTGTGLAVTITASTGNAVEVNDYWSFAARPLTPNVIYPDRLLTTAQPPDGPRRFLCPLAVLGRSARQWQRLDDCTLPFDTLVELTARQPGTNQGCCVTVGPDQAKNLQEIIDKLAASGTVGNALHLEPGNYDLPAPLRITSRHNGLVIENCTGGRVVLRAASNALAGFDHGMVLLSQADGVTLKGLEFSVPIVPLGQAVRDMMQTRPGAAKAEMKASAIAIHVDGTPPGAPIDPRAAAHVTIENCTFVFSAAAEFLGVGILGRDAIPMMQVRGCLFYSSIKEGQAPPFVTGVLITPTFDQERKVLVSPQVTSVRLSDNEFFGLSLGGLIAGRICDVRVSGNEVSGGFGGLALVTLPALLNQWADLDKVPAGQDSSDPDFALVEQFSRAFIDDNRVGQTIELAALIPALSKPGTTTQQTAPLTMRLDASANRLETISRIETASRGFGLSGATLGGVADSYGPSLYVWNAAREASVFANITGNTCLNQSNLVATMMVLMADQCSITGNLMTNTGVEDGDKIRRMALLVVPGGRVESQTLKAQVNLFAVTGNTMLGRSNLNLWPRKEWASRLAQLNVPLMTWDFFNTEA